MPTLDQISDGYRFFFYSFDCGEPMHVHVQRGRETCKFWLQPLKVASNNGFRPHEINRIRRIIMHNLSYIVAMWEKHCGEE